jgi:hypothetical protein
MVMRKFLYVALNIYEGIFMCELNIYKAIFRCEASANIVFV